MSTPRIAAVAPYTHCQADQVMPTAFTVWAPEKLSIEWTSAGREGAAIIQAYAALQNAIAGACHGTHDPTNVGLLPKSVGTIGLRLVASAEQQLEATASAFLNLIWLELESYVMSELVLLGNTMRSLIKSSGSASASVVEALRGCRIAADMFRQQPAYWPALHQAPTVLLGNLNPDTLVRQLSAEAAQNYEGAWKMLVEGWVEALAQYSDLLSGLIAPAVAQNQAVEWLRLWRTFYGLHHQIQGSAGWLQSGIGTAMQPHRQLDEWLAGRTAGTQPRTLLAYFLQATAQHVAVQLRPALSLAPLSGVDNGSLAVSALSPLPDAHLQAVNVQLQLSSQRLTTSLAEELGPFDAGGSPTFADSTWRAAASAEQWLLADCHPARLARLASQPILAELLLELHKPARPPTSAASRSSVGDGAGAVEALSTTTQGRTLAVSRGSGGGSARPQDVDSIPVVLYAGSLLQRELQAEVHASWACSTSVVAASQDRNVARPGSARHRHMAGAMTNLAAAVTWVPGTIGVPCADKQLPCATNGAALERGASAAITQPTEATSARVGSVLSLYRRVSDLLELLSADGPASGPRAAQLAAVRQQLQRDVALLSSGPRAAAGPGLLRVLHPTRRLELLHLTCTVAQAAVSSVCHLPSLYPSSASMRSLVSGHSAGVALSIALQHVLHAAQWLVYGPPSSEELVAAAGMQSTMWDLAVPPSCLTVKDLAAGSGIASSSSGVFSSGLLKFGRGAVKNRVHPDNRTSFDRTTSSDSSTSGFLSSDAAAVATTDAKAHVTAFTAGPSGRPPADPQVLVLYRTGVAASGEAFALEQLVSGLLQLHQGCAKCLDFIVTDFMAACRRVWSAQTSDASWRIKDVTPTPSPAMQQVAAELLAPLRQALATAHPAAHVLTLTAAITASLAVLNEQLVAAGVLARGFRSATAAGARVTCDLALMRQELASGVAQVASEQCAELVASSQLHPEDIEACLAALSSRDPTSRSCCLGAVWQLYESVMSQMEGVALQLGCESFEGRGALASR